MQRRKLIALLALGVITVGSLLVTGGYGLYLRSDHYREHCASVLTRALGLPSEIGRVVPRSRTTREFRDVRVWLPEKRDEAARCDTALVTLRPTPDDPEAFELLLSGGASEISTRTWLREDYRFVLESGLRPGFDPNGPRRVELRDMDLTFVRNGFRAALRGANGQVLFEDPHRGLAHLTCGEFNGHAPDKPVTLRGEFSPQTEGIRLDRILLDVPRMPIATIGLNHLANLNLQSGAFDGRLIYQEADAGDTLTVSGRLFEVQLDECTAGLLARPWRGRAPEIELAELTLLNDRLARIRFRSQFTDVSLGDILSLWNMQGVGGWLQRLSVDEADLSAKGIDHLVLSGRCDDVSLAEVSDALGWGRMTGTARLILGDLTIEANRLVSLDATIEVLPAGQEDNFIERALLVEVMQRAGGINLPPQLVPLLPERLSYTRLGARFEVRDEILHVYGTHGDGEETILSARIAGREWPILPEPGDAFDLRPVLDIARIQLREHLAEHLETFEPRSAWEILSASTWLTPGQLPRTEQEE